MMGSGGLGECMVFVMAKPAVFFEPAVIAESAVFAKPAVISKLAVFVQPARHALWVGSSYWGTRNRHPPTGHTSLYASVKTVEQPDAKSHSTNRTACLGLQINIDSSTIVARQAQGVTADFWYPSMRRATPAPDAQRVPKKLSQLSLPRRAQAFENPAE